MNLWARALTEVDRQGHCVMIEIVRAEGSTPREEGAQMMVTPRGYSGTIGGGTLEWHAMAEAQLMLGKPASVRTLVRSLGPDLGQCCGGRVTLRLESFGRGDIEKLRQAAAAEPEALTRVHIWGAGHVGRALALALAPLPFATSWWDQRAEAFPSLVPENVTCRAGHPGDMREPGLVVVMTHSHALDFEIVDGALRNTDFFKVGLIGSNTKAARFRKRLREAGHGDMALQRLVCPVGSKAIQSKLPAVIAASVAVQLLEWQQMLKTAEISLSAPQHLDMVKP